MNNKILNSILISLAAAVMLFGCAKKLDIFPQNELTPEKVYANAAGYNAVLAKIYATLSTTGNSGPAGSPDIGGGLDEGSQVAFIRGFFNCQELTTDEAVVAWNDQTIQEPQLLQVFQIPRIKISFNNEFFLFKIKRICLIKFTI